MGGAAEGQYVYGANSQLCSMFAFAFGMCKDLLAHFHGRPVVLTVGPSRPGGWGGVASRRRSRCAAEHVPSNVWMFKS